MFLFVRNQQPSGLGKNASETDGNNNTTAFFAPSSSPILLRLPRQVCLRRSFHSDLSPHQRMSSNLRRTLEDHQRPSLPMEYRFSSFALQFLPPMCYSFYITCHLYRAIWMITHHPAQSQLWKSLWLPPCRYQTNLYRLMVCVRIHPMESEAIHRRGMETHATRTKIKYAN